MHVRLILPLLLCLALPTWSQVPRNLTFKASYALQTDSNFFRLPDSANLYQLTGQSSRSERVGISSLNANYVLSRGLQKFILDGTLADYRYQNFDRYNFTARNYAAAWLWSLTPQLTGNLSRERKQTLNSFTDYQGFNQRNQRTDTTSRLDANYQLGAQWQLQAGLGQIQQSNEQALFAGGDYSANQADIGLRHTSAAGNSLAYKLRRSHGDYFNRTLPNSGSYDNTYVQTDHELRLNLPLNGTYSVDANLTALSRSHPTYPERDYSGIASGISLNWLLSGKTALNAAYSHQLSSYQTSTSNYAQADRISLGAQWTVSPKVLVNLNTAKVQTDFLGHPNATFADQRRDSTTDTTLGLTWQPYQRLNLNAAIQSAARSSNQANLDYHTSVTTLSADYGF